MNEKPQRALYIIVDNTDSDYSRITIIIMSVYTLCVCVRVCERVCMCEMETLSYARRVNKHVARSR